MRGAVLSYTYQTQLCNPSSSTVWCYQSSVMPVKCGLLTRRRAQPLKSRTEFLKQLLHIRKSTASEIVLAEFGRYPLLIHFWQQVLRYHNRVLKLNNSRLVKIAFSEGAGFVDGRVLEIRAQGWRPNFTALLTTQPGDASMFQSLDVTAIIERQKEAYLSAFLNNEAISTLVLYRSLQPEYRYAHYLSAVQCFPIGGCDVVVMVCMSILAVLSTPPGRTECVKSASQVVLRTSIIFCLTVQPMLTSGTVMPPFSMAFRQFLLSSIATILVC